MSCRIRKNYVKKPKIVLHIFQLSWLLKLSSANMTTIIIARIFCGLSAGGCFAVVPMYVKEISQDNIRGQLGSLLIMFQNIGVLIMFILGAYLGYFTTLYSVIWLPFLTFLILLKTPESPAYVLKIGKVNVSTLWFCIKSKFVLIRNHFGCVTCAVNFSRNIHF